MTDKYPCGALFMAKGPADIFAFMTTASIKRDDSGKAKIIWLNEFALRRNEILMIMDKFMIDNDEFYQVLVGENVSVVMAGWLHYYVSVKKMLIRI